MAKSLVNLTGFSKATQADSSKAVSLIVKSYTANNTQYGSINTPDEADGLIQKLSQLPQTQDVQSALLDAQNKKAQLTGKITSIAGNKDVFDMQLKEQLNAVAQANLKSPLQLIGAMATVYSQAAESYDNEVMKNIYGTYGSDSTVPSDMIAYRKTLQDKAKMLGSLFNSYNSVDTATGEVGALNPNDFGIVFDTNPANGRISNVDVVTTDKINTNDYMRTDTPIAFGAGVKPLPMYLRAYDDGVANDGKVLKKANLGNLVFSGVSTAAKGTDTQGGGIGQLTLQNEGTGFFGRIGNFFSGGKNDDQDYDSLKKGGISLDNPGFQYDKNAIPSDTIVRIGSKTYYSANSDNNLLEITGATSDEKNTNLNKYLTSIGKDPKSVKTYFGDKDFLYAGDGTSKVKGKIDQNALGVKGASAGTNVYSPANPQFSMTAFGSAPTPPAEGGAPATETAGSTTPSFFASRTNNGNKPNTQMQTTTPSIIDQGKSFFRAKVN